MYPDTPLVYDHIQQNNPVYIFWSSVEVADPPSAALHCTDEAQSVVALLAQNV